MAYAQDIHFSQFYDSPLTLNPATTGNFRGDYRISHIYRSQWRDATKTPQDTDTDFYQDNQYGNNGVTRKPYMTLNLGVDLPLYLGDHRFGAGLMIYHDEAGREEIAGVERKLTTTKITGSLSYIADVEGHKISIGLQPAITQKSSSGGDTYKEADSWDNTNNIDRTQLDPFWGQIIGTNNEQLPAKGTNIKYFDFNAGLMWSKDFGRLEPRVGLAMFHIINPKESLMQDPDNRQPNRNVISVDAKYDINSRFFLMPHALFMSHKRVSDMVYGANIGYNLSNVMLNGKIEFNYVYFGPQIRHSVVNADAIIGVVGVNLKRWNVGISRDFTLSTVKTGSGGTTGAWEVSIIYIKPETLLQKKAIPCERY